MPQLPNTWKLEDAKARLSEVVRRARSQGPQLVTVRGQPAVVVMAAEAAAATAAQERESLADFLAASSLGQLDLSRQDDRGPEVTPWPVG